MSDGGRERASLGAEVWKSSQKWSVQRSAVRSIAWLDVWPATEQLPSPVCSSEDIDERTDQRPLQSSDEDGADSMQFHRTNDEQKRGRQIEQKNRHPDHATFNAAAGDPQNVDQRDKRRVEDEQPSGNRPASENGERAHTSNEN